jgi:hypothetical protein
MVRIHLPPAVSPVRTTGSGATFAMGRVARHEMVRGVAAGAEPEVRIHLPPAVRPVRTTGCGATFAMGRVARREMILRSKRYPGVDRVVCSKPAGRTPNRLSDSRIGVFFRSPDLYLFRCASRSLAQSCRISASIVRSFFRCGLRSGNG